MNEQSKSSQQDSESQTDPTLYQQGEKFLAEVLEEGKKAVHDASEFLVGMSEGDSVQDTEQNDEFNMRNQGRKFMGDVRETIADAADSFSRSLVGDKSTPRTHGEESSSNSEGITFEHIAEVTKKSLAETASAVSLAAKGGGKATKCNNPNCGCADCACAESACQCGNDKNNGSKCKNPNCRCADCECVEGECQC